MKTTYLVVPFAEKEAVKSLGARWDAEAKRWFVPAGRELSAFGSWLPADVDVAQTSALALQAPTDVAVAAKGISLSRLLAGVSTVVAEAFKTGVWTIAEIVGSRGKGGHVYLELSERDASGNVIAQARAAIWATTAARIIPEFERLTGVEIGAGIKVLVRARPVFKAQFGFNLEIDAIDPAYTLGDLEAKKRDIRTRLQKDGVFGRNRALPAPWDFVWLLVVAPQGAAGLGDFAKEAERLERCGLCRFIYVHSRFQGDGAADEIRAVVHGALNTWAHPSRPDAVVIIRGGGAVNDLAWLNDYALARFICDCDIPVLTGIGHERDETSLDEVAHVKFDTPSKVIAGIEQLIARRAKEARASFDLVIARAGRDVDRQLGATERLNAEVRSFAVSTTMQAHAAVDRIMKETHLAAVQSVHRAKADSLQLMSTIKHGAATDLAATRHLLPIALGEVRAFAVGSIRTARTEIERQLPDILERASRNEQQARSGIESALQSVSEHAARMIDAGKTRTQALFQEIVGQGPAKTLKRGFAMVSAATGSTVTSAMQAASSGPLELRFADGVIGVEVQRPSLRKTHLNLSGDEDQDGTSHNI